MSHHISHRQLFFAKTSLPFRPKAGTQGVELLNWLAMRGAVSAGGASVSKVHGNYHIPISNTATGLLALEVA